MSIICPTVTANDPHTFRSQIDRILPFAQRIHIDLADGIFAPKLIDINQLWWPPHTIVDVHMMFRKPLDYIDEVVRLKPSLIVIHAECDGNFKQLVETLRSANIKVGVALLKTTPLEVILSEIQSIDHILIFSGHLGHFGGEANLDLLNKVQRIKDLSKPIEVGWDGGINDENVSLLAKGGVDVLNVGGFIQQSDNPIDAYAKLNLELIDGQ
jgi:ribulose-phosphate 3-epimerase